jgi:hypothetical protein
VFEQGMMNRDDMRFAGYLIAGYLAFAEVLSWETSKWPACLVVSEYQSADNQSGNQTCATFHEGIIRGATFLWGFLTHDNVTAAATVVIAVFTWTLWRSSEKLWRVTRLSTIAARRSANAAVRAAENAEKALHSLEIPRVYPVELKFSVFEDPHHAPLIATVSASLKNFGRSPAFLKELYLIVAVTNLVRHAGDRPLYHSGRIPFMAEDVIGDKETVGPFEKSIHELVPYCSRIKDGSLHLGLLVSHRIDDALGNTFGRGAWYVWNPRRQKFVAGVQLWTDN